MSTQTTTTPLPQRRPARPGTWAALAGLAAGAAGIAGGELAAAFLSPLVSPVTALGGAVIDAVPPWLKDAAIQLFGTSDKVVLVASIMVVAACLAAMAGLLERRRAGLGLALAALAGAAGLTAVVTRAQAGPQAALAPIIAAAITMVLLRTLVRRLGAWVPPGADPQADRAPLARRSFLNALAGTSIAAVVAGTVSSILTRATAVASGFRGSLTLPAPVTTPQAIPAGSTLGLDGISPLVTPNADFYRIDTALTVPAIDPPSWKLKVTGMVEREIEIDFATLLAKPMTERHITIACVSNNVGGELIGNALWLGWPVRELLAMAGPTAGADMVFSTSNDGWTASTPLEALTDDRDALLAVGMNGEPLPLEHGFPVRMIVPGLYGFVSATKWLTELKVTRFADDVAYWTPRGWSDHGPIKTQSRIDVPRSGRTVKAGTVRFGGVAWAQHRGVQRVEVRINRGTWKQAELGTGISTDTWYQWQLGVELTPGDYEVQVRATDATGTPQTEDKAPVAPDGATGFHTINVKVD
ncbi:molybdopterin-dependent oxidoreductase [Paenarthrobacter ilicis]|uniref:DMSO/TMAO reductase YedYZ molybdopterin-dependent catalytic subunit n=1 Tax=Paenarthrobacter ilicis TaxID=43665 RepID=A0ABX0TKB4_9MICC|nr:molybdopterin-dependent oxidoreductase [Paenarthrobacter ilicis]MBM7792784.1 DMSO/TMAO reductase YedYZ molybdopterin-dependent catalytic subunit [Paenarthrobacter ilicis]NIJ01127.1 DMSO/TMAO reductase YedYZ molybdopterin-dependent catalytic subunit [Paenarthrobacter ilicis]